MLVTINTDASFHHKYNVGAFAFWAVSDEFKITKAGYFRDECRNPTECESKAIINAVKVVLSSNKNITKIIFNTDSLNSKSIFENNRSNINRYGLHFGKNLRKRFKKIVNSYHRNIQVEFRHVKAHSGVNDARSYVNEWCDKNAKYYLWQKINQNKSNK